jgi:hypothetical protein
MLSNDSFSFNLIQKYMAVFGSLFNGIQITRSIANNQTQLFEVPLSYANKEKMLVRDMEDPDIDKQAAITLPRMSYEMIALGYDGERNNPGIMKRATKIANDPTSLNYQYSGVPYNMLMNLYIYVKNMSDGTKIVEQILPFFQPDYTVSCNLIEDNDVTVDIPIIYNGIKLENSTSNVFSDKQVIIWTLSFTVKGWFYGPVRNKKIIRFIKTNIHTGDTSSPIDFNVDMQPGLDANGNPTTLLANSINVESIKMTDDFGIIRTITDNTSKIYISSNTTSNTVYYNSGVSWLIL